MRIQNLWYARRKLRKRIAVSPSEEGTVKCELPWGLSIHVSPADAIGEKIIRLGVFDLAVCEAIARLASPGDLIVDAGANCGQMTSLMACAAGFMGKVLAIEPHPRTFDLLRRNVAEWRFRQDISVISLHQCALAAESGSAELVEPAGFSQNSGLARLSTGETHIGRHVVKAVRLDELLSECPRIAMLKLDVEGYELKVLEGSSDLLESGAIRNIVFEDHDSHHSPVFHFLSARGFSVFAFDLGLFKPRLVPAGPQLRTMRGTNFLATLDSDQAMQRFRKKGYASLARRRSGPVD